MHLIYFQRRKTKRKCKLALKRL